MVKSSNKVSNILFFVNLIKLYKKLFFHLTKPVKRRKPKNKAKRSKRTENEISKIFENVF